MLFLRTAITSVLLLFSSFINAAGYVDKDHYLYPIMIDIRYHKYDEAMAKLEPYAEKGDATALFWYGYMKQSNWGRDRFAAYKWYEKSIEGKNPYSMFKLSGEENTAYVCEVNGWRCSADNLDKAVERWKGLADAGDVRAKYYYQYYSRSFFGVAYDAWIGSDDENAIISAAKKGYLQPLIKSIDTAYRNGYEEFWGEEMYQFLLMNIDKDPKIAMHFVINPYEGMTHEERRSFLLDSLKKGYQASSFSLFIEKKIISKEEAYVYKKAKYIGRGEDTNKDLNMKVFDLSEKKITELNKEAQEFFNSIEHVINFDEMNFMSSSKQDV